MTGQSRQQWVAAGWCQAKWVCQTCAVLAHCLLSQLLAQSPVSSTPERIQLLLLSSSGGLMWLSNEHFSWWGELLPTISSFPVHIFCPILLLAFFLSLSLALVTSSSGPGLCLSHRCSFCAHSSHCPYFTFTFLTCWQQFTNCLPSPFLFLYSSSALLKASTIQALWIQLLCNQNISISSPLVVSAVCPVFLY